ncbi:MAG: HD domain-containing protein [Deltaproteobacteria bacterium]|nr:HD domain-containing protein [Deltaproteobacteria bacterium]
MIYPDYSTCLTFLTDEGVSAGVLKHVKAVHLFAVVIGKRLQEQGIEINMPLLEAGALLHDIGRSKTHGLLHAIAGCEIAERLGLESDVILIIRNHIGAGITKEEAAQSGLPAEDFIPVTLEEKIVAAADNLAFGDNLQTIRQHEQNMIRQGVIEGAERCVALHRELSQMCGIDLDELLTGYLPGFIGKTRN